MARDRLAREPRVTPHSACVEENLRAESKPTFPSDRVPWRDGQQTCRALLWLAENRW